jgi:type VI secretion system protein ImpB
VRPTAGTPRVSITYDREIGDTIEKHKLPFVVGVRADLSGHPPCPLPGLLERRFVEINQDNFDGVVAAIHPSVLLTVSNRLTDEHDPALRIDLFFRENR